MTPSWRKPAGALAILALIVLWCALVASVASASGTVGQWWWPLQALFYLVTGIIWIAPLKPLLRWMER